MSKRKYIFYLEDIEEAIDNVKEYTKGYDFESFLSDRKTVDAVLRNFSVIGESSNHIPKNIRELNLQIDWEGVMVKQ